MRHHLLPMDEQHRPNDGLPKECYTSYTSMNKHLYSCKRFLRSDLLCICRLFALRLLRLLGSNSLKVDHNVDIWSARRHEKAGQQGQINRRKTVMRIVVSFSGPSSTLTSE